MVAGFARRRIWQLGMSLRRDPYQSSQRRPSCRSSLEPGIGNNRAGARCHAAMPALDLLGYCLGVQDAAGILHLFQGMAAVASHHRDVADFLATIFSGMVFWQLVAPVVTTVPLCPKASRSSGIAEISQNLSSTVRWRSTTPIALSQAKAMCALIASVAETGTWAAHPATESTTGCAIEGAGWGCYIAAEGCCVDEFSAEAGSWHPGPKSVPPFHFGLTLKLRIDCFSMPKFHSHTWIKPAGPSLS